MIFLCVIDRRSPPEIWCEVSGRFDGPAEPEYTTSRIKTDYDVWHTFRIEVESEILATFFVDNQKIGQYQPSYASELKGQDFIVRFGAWSPQKDGIEANFDDVRLGIVK